MTIRLGQRTTISPLQKLGWMGASVAYWVLTFYSSIISFSEYKSVNQAIKNYWSNRNRWKCLKVIQVKKSIKLERCQEGEYFEDIEGSWLETWRTWSFLTSWMVFFTPRKIPWKFCIDIPIRSVSGGESRRVQMEDVEGSWRETWKTGSSLMTWMTLGDPKDHGGKPESMPWRVPWSMPRSLP